MGGSEFRSSVFRDKAEVQKVRGSAFIGQTLKNCLFFAILYSKVQGSVQFLGGSDIQSSLSEHEFRFGRFKVRFSDGK